MVADADELCMFMRYPRFYHLLGNCMSGRQMEAELILNFLLHTQPHGAGKLEVLPIVGPS
jgi:hypothetical protein